LTDNGGPRNCDVQSWLMLSISTVDGAARNFNLAAPASLTVQKLVGTECMYSARNKCTVPASWPSKQSSQSSFGDRSRVLFAANLFFWLPGQGRGEVPVKRGDKGL